jgi:hypothetical protein
MDWGRGTMSERKQKIEAWLASSRHFLSEKVQAVREQESPRDLTAELESNRTATLKLLADLPEAVLDLPVRHPTCGDMTVASQETRYEIMRPHKN